MALVNIYLQEYERVDLGHQVKDLCPCNRTTRLIETVVQEDPFLSQPLTSSEVIPGDGPHGPTVISTETGATSRD
jgi:hypothetical protein